MALVFRVTPRIGVGRVFGGVTANSAAVTVDAEPAGQEVDSEVARLIGWGSWEMVSSAYSYFRQ